MLEIKAISPGECKREGSNTNPRESRGVKGGLCDLSSLLSVRTLH